MEKVEVETVVDIFSEILKIANDQRVVNLAKKGIEIYTDQHGDKAQLKRDRDSHKI